MKVETLEPITIPAGKKVYFASDFHFGIPNQEESKKREKRIIKWLESIKNTASHLFLLGDIFDTWIEFKTVVPKGNIRFLGKLAELKDSGVEIIIFTGNHDLWMYGYFEQELDIPVYHNNVKIKINNKQFFIGHGDGLGPGDKKYKFLKSFLNNKLCQWLYGWVHPDIGVTLAAYFSKKGADKKYLDLNYLGDEHEFLYQFCQTYIAQNHVDYFVFGHRHLMLQKNINEVTKYINLGDWISYNSYLIVSSDTVELVQFYEN